MCFNTTSFGEVFFFFFFNDTATTEIYTLSLHDALPIWDRRGEGEDVSNLAGGTLTPQSPQCPSRACQLNGDRKSTRLNSSHSQISYAVFCLKKKTTIYRLSYRLIEQRTCVVPTPRGRSL